jgi:hypothetical protein
MDFDVLTTLSWREALIAIVALLVLYVVVAFWRMQRLKRRNALVRPPASLSAQSAVAAYAAVQEPVVPEAPVAPVLLSEPSEAAFPWNEPPPEIPGQRLIEALEREVAQLRKEVDSLRAEVLVLREQQQLELSQSKATQNISPLYSDAMQMAIQGNDAATISLHCGIARAEAELVVALVRNRDMQ